MVQKLREVVDGSHWQHVETVVVTSTYELAVISPGGTSYEPGVIRGWMISWDFAAGRIACAGPVDASNSSSVITGDSAEMRLRRDLWHNSVQAGLVTLRAVE